MRNRAENKTRPNSRRNPSGLCGRREAIPKPTSVRQMLCVYFYSPATASVALEEANLSRGVRLGILSVSIAIGARQAANPTFTATERFILLGVFAQHSRDPCPSKVDYWINLWNLLPSSSPQWRKLKKRSTYMLNDIWRYSKFKTII